MLKNSFSLLLHGDAGVGKTRLSGTAQPPVLVLDLEGRARYLPGKKIGWDVMTENPPEPGDWTHCIAVSTQFNVLERAYQWLQSGKHPFRSVVVDSLSFAQKRFISDLTGTQQLQESTWGEVLRVLETLVRDFCDLPLQPGNPVETVVFTAGTKSDGNRRIPLLQGALKDTAAYLFDAVGYLYLAPDPSGGNSRQLLVEPQAGIVAKDNTDRLGGPVIVNPDLSVLTQRLVD
jgi:hypothetical protein